MEKVLKGVSSLNQKLIAGSFIYLMVGILTTAIFPVYTFLTNDMVFVEFAAKNFIKIAIAQLILTVIIGSLYKKMNIALTGKVFISFTFLTGVTLSCIAVKMPIGYLIYSLVSAAILFAIMGVVGLTTKTDMTSYKNILLSALICIIVTSIGNLFLGSSILMYVISFVTIIVFAVMVAYDLNKMKKEKLETIKDVDKLVIVYAFELYLDFLNIFLSILRITTGLKD